jgi:hypothetical protein
MLAFAVLYSLKLTQMLEFAESISAFQPYPLDHWGARVSPTVDSRQPCSSYVLL